MKIMTIDFRASPRRSNNSSFTLKRTENPFKSTYPARHTKIQPPHFPFAKRRGIKKRISFPVFSSPTREVIIKSLFLVNHAF